MNGELLDLFHIYIGLTYLGNIRARDEQHAMTKWAAEKKVSRIILRAEKAPTVRQTKEKKK